MNIQLIYIFMLIYSLFNDKIFEFQIMLGFKNTFSHNNDTNLNLFPF